MILHDLDWGNVPSWLGAGSLLLAFRIFLRDRTASDRVQIDQVGLWGAMEGEPRSVPGQDNLKYAVVRCWVRNASNLPIYIVGFESVAELETYSDAANYGLHQERDLSQDLHARLRPVAPGETYTLPVASHVVWTVSPDNNDYTFPMSVHFTVSKICIIDSTGRKWICNPTKGQPIRVHPYKPRTWKIYRQMLKEPTQKDSSNSVEQFIENMIIFINEVNESDETTKG